tara:strand:- start:295 stop:573 length:279 start_codon:yes stop_codon:yes gene_type:complete
METLIEGLAQYGPLGMWTASLLWMNWQQRKDQKEEEKMAAERMQYHQENIVSAMQDQKHMLEKAIEKIDEGLEAMKEKYAEDRILRMTEKER